jgi:hypothetical protein
MGQTLCGGKGQGIDRATPAAIAGRRHHGRYNGGDRALGSRRYAVRVRRTVVALGLVPTSERIPTTIPTMKLFHRVATEIDGSAKVEMISQIPTAVLTKRTPGDPIAISATATVMIPMIQVFAY